MEPVGAGNRQQAGDLETPDVRALASAHTDEARLMQGSLTVRVGDCNAGKGEQDVKARARLAVLVTYSHHLEDGDCHMLIQVQDAMTFLDMRLRE